jgi:hypothetical protein
MDLREPEKLPIRAHFRQQLRQGLLRFLRPAQVQLTDDGPQYLAQQLSHQFGDELDTRKLKALRL